MSPKPALRSTRAAVFAAVCVVLATAGHSVAADAVVAPWAMGVGFLGAYGVAWVLTGSERSLPTILGGLLGGQFVLHALFMSATSGAGMNHAGNVPIDPGHGSWAMTAAHGVAGFAAAWWLRRGERAVWLLARRVALLASRAFRVFLSVLEAAPAAPDRRPLPPGALRTSSACVREPLRHAVVRRGPPPSLVIRA